MHGGHRAEAAGTIISSPLLMFHAHSRAGSRMKLRAGISSTVDMIETRDSRYRWPRSIPSKLNVQIEMFLAQAASSQMVRVVRQRLAIRSVAQSETNKWLPVFTETITMHAM